VAEVFAELLHCEIDVTTPFFQLGATSLTLVRAQRRLAARLDPDLTVLDLLTYPTVRALAAHIAARTAPAGGDRPGPAAPEPSPHPPSTPPAASPAGRPNTRRAARAQAAEVAR
jgi:acyl carrier protein